ncbi:MAG: hypothetical protein VKP57_04020 [Candidatus Sericytochromatia bacterium]|nr:hypothetical protein [Candidatus Sericytochromatia bacterium]
MGLDPLQEPGSQYGRSLEPRRDNLGIEPEDPRWRSRDPEAQPAAAPPPTEQAPGRLGQDRTRFTARVEDPFSVLIREQVPVQQAGQEEGTPLPDYRRFGLPELDRAWGGLWPRCYLLEGPWPFAGEIAHHLAINVAKTRRATFVSHHASVRDLTLRTLARLKAPTAGLDLVRARALAEAYRPVRDNLRLLSLRGWDSADSLGKRVAGDETLPMALVVIGHTRLAPAEAALPEGPGGLLLRWPGDTPPGQEIRPLLAAMRSLQKRLEAPLLLVRPAAEESGPDLETWAQLVPTLSVSAPDGNHIRCTATVPRTWLAVRRQPERMSWTWAWDESRGIQTNT